MITDQAKFLEKIANVIHTEVLGIADNNVTTTVGYYSNTLYVANQSDNPKLQRLVDLDGSIGKKDIRDNVRRCSRSDGFAKMPAANLLVEIRKKKELVGKLIPLRELLQAAAGSDAPPIALDNLKVKWIRRADLTMTDSGFAGNTGFHGESYIIRYLALKSLRGVQCLPPNRSRAQHEDEEQSLIRELSARFADSLHGVYIASSQGACKYCKKMMDSLGIHYASEQGPKDRDQSWLHPFTLAITQNGEVGKIAESTRWWMSRTVREQFESRETETQRRAEARDGFHESLRRSGESGFE